MRWQVLDLFFIYLSILEGRKKKKKKKRRKKREGEGKNRAPRNLSDSVRVSS